jgi:hypothetical protein
LQNPFIEKEKFDIKKWTKKYLVLIILFIFTGVLATSYFLNRRKINDNGIYVLARVFEVSDYRTATKCSKYEYFYKGHKFIGGSCGNFDQVGDLYFIKLIPSDPANHYDLEFTHVPNCLTMDSVPFEGWRTLPLDKCK